MHEFVRKGRAVVDEILGRRLVQLSIVEPIAEKTQGKDTLDLE